MFPNLSTNLYLVTVLSELFYILKKQEPVIFLKCNPELYEV